MRIGSRIFIVGAIPTAVAASIAVAAILLLKEVDQARGGAAIAGTVYRTLLTAVIARNDYLHAAPNARSAQERRFLDLTSQARGDLMRLRALQPGDGTTGDADNTLSHYVDDMSKLVRVTGESDRMVEDMRARAATLIALTDRARERQHASNADIVTSLTEDDGKLRAALGIVDAAYAARITLASIETALTDIALAAEPSGQADGQRQLLFDGARQKQTAADIVARLDAQGDALPADAALKGEGIASRVGALTASFAAAEDKTTAGTRQAVKDLAQWSEKVLKVFSTEYRSLHEEIAQLLTYSVQAHETELATQNIAIGILKLSNRSAEALARRDEATARAILASSQVLSDTIAALPIPPLIQAEMAEAFKRWHDGLDSTTARIGQQTALLTAMDDASADMIRAARSLDASFSANAEATARSIQAVLILGAAMGLLVGGGTAYVVARSMTRPLGALQTRIMRAAHDPAAGLIEDEGRRDELGDIARAANVFLGEIARRERALRRAKEQADTALVTLRRTQAELIQAEKLASLGQLVAGVAHEINTPIGIALTTATVVDEEAARFRTAARDGKISRSALDRLIERVSEGATLLATNLTRAADLIQSFRHVAADQVSGERREFDMHVFLHQLLVSLGPMLRKTGHSAAMDCPKGLVLDSYPGALAQVITNLVVNASLHAFRDGQVGHITVTAMEAGAGLVRLVVGDDGRGIAAEHLAKVFDPFFTTRRSQGSTGLGLGIVYNLVTSTLQGRVDLDSRPGQGTRFTIEIPRTVASPRAIMSEDEVLS